MRLEKLKAGEFNYFANEDWNGYAVVVKKWRRPYRYFNQFTKWLFVSVLKIKFDVFILDGYLFHKKDRQIKNGGRYEITTKNY